MTPTRPEDIRDAVWSGCATFRGAVDPDQYKSYLLAFLFLKYISDLWSAHAAGHRERLKDADPETRELRVNRLMDRERFKLPMYPLRDRQGEVVETFRASFDSLYARRGADNIGELINEVLEAIEAANDPKLKSVFRNIDFNSEANFGQARDRNRRLKTLLEDFANLDLRGVSEDVIGDAYIFLIERFASDAGKKAGEFFTPRRVSELVAKLAAPRPGDEICDPASGSGSLLLRAGEEVGGENFRLYGQESNGQTRALARMNMFLHGRDEARIDWCDTLNGPTLIEGDHLKRFDVVVANPPFSLDKWGAENADSDRYRRFVRGIPPKSKGDYAFILHMLAVARPGEGRVAVIAPHGVLFRGGAEGRIRESIVRDNLLDAVVGLPAQLFPTTGIPVCILLFDRARESGGRRDHERDVMFVDASRDFEPGKKQNRLREADIAQVVETVRGRQEVERYAHRAELAEIEKNGFNLNIPRYVDTFVPEPEIDIQAVQNEIRDLERQIAENRERMNAYLRELGVDA